MIRRLYNPGIFQGNLKRTSYFEGWYFKHVSGDLNYVYSFIPGISLTNNHSHAFIQIIDGITGMTEYVEYPLKEFTWNRKRLSVKVGKSLFTDNNILLDIDSNNVKIKGEIEYTNLVRYPRRFFSPGIMGWYSFVPFMECKHGIISANHSLSGTIKSNGDTIDFTSGKGYIEKDWGISFPETWIWIQCNNFSDNATSFSFSIAKIPWLRKFFIGFIAFLYYDNKYILFTSYNNSSVYGIKQDKKTLSLTLENKEYVLKIRAVRKSSGELRAPSTGEMSRRIKESIDSDIHLTLYDLHGNNIYEDAGKRAGLEIIDTIFDYV